MECQIRESNLTWAEFNSSIFKNCEFLNSNLDLILVEDLKVWKSNEWIQIKDFFNFEKLLD